jgi:hypothetical protein
VVNLEEGVLVDIRVTYTNTSSKERYDESGEKAESQPALMRGVVGIIILRHKTYGGH